MCLFTVRLMHLTRINSLVCEPVGKSVWSFMLVRKDGDCNLVEDILYDFMNGWKDSILV